MKITCCRVQRWFLCEAKNERLPERWGLLLGHDSARRKCYFPIELILFSLRSRNMRKIYGSWNPRVSHELRRSFFSARSFEFILHKLLNNILEYFIFPLFLARFRCIYKLSSTEWRSVSIHSRDIYDLRYLPIFHLPALLRTFSFFL